jgi:hypothetical protein
LILQQDIGTPHNARLTQEWLQSFHCYVWTFHSVVWAAETTFQRLPIPQDGEVKMAIREWFFMVLWPDLCLD